MSGRMAKGESSLQTAFEKEGEVLVPFSWNLIRAFPPHRRV